MSEIPYTRGSRIADEQPTKSWIDGKNAEDLPKVIKQIVEAERAPQQYSASGERLEITLHKKAQGLVAKGTSEERYQEVERLLEAQRAKPRGSRTAGD